MWAKVSVSMWFPRGGGGGGGASMSPRGSWWESVYGSMPRRGPGRVMRAV